MPNIELQQNTTNRELKKILSSKAGMKTMLLQMAKDQVSERTVSMEEGAGGRRVVDFAAQGTMELHISWPSKFVENYFMA